MLYLSTEEVNARIREAVSGIKEPVQVYIEEVCVCSIKAIYQN